MSPADGSRATAERAALERQLLRHFDLELALAHPHPRMPGELGMDGTAVRRTGKAGRRAVHDAETAGSATGETQPGSASLLPGSLTSATEEALLDVDALGLRVARYQLAHNVAYARYARRLGVVSPADIEDPLAAPPVPTDAFKRTVLTSFDPADAVATFRSSGTTASERGVHPMRTLELTRRAAAGPIRRWLLPDHDPHHAPLVHVLMPPAASLPESSLAYMCECIRSRWGAQASAHWVDPTTGLDADGLVDALAEAEAADVPVVLLGPSFAYVHLLDARPDLGMALPAGSRLMETGGFKGKSRTVPRPELHAALVGALGLEPWAIVGEYGMSELSSQLWEPTLALGLAGRPWQAARGLYAGPPWLRARVLDPDTLENMAAGEVGQVALFDPANLDSVAHVITGDLGRFVAEPETGRGAIELLGRAAHAAPKGCSLALDQLLEQV